MYAVSRCNAIEQAFLKWQMESLLGVMWYIYIQVVEKSICSSAQFLPAQGTTSEVSLLTQETTC